MKQLLIQSGRVRVDDVPAPTVGPKEILVHVAVSAVSAGTESAGVALSGLPLYRRALKRPDQVRRVLAMARRDGIAATMNVVGARVREAQPTGYAASGTIVAVGEEVDGFAAGDRVACAGAGIANHAELISVPVNLAVRLPDSVPFEAGATATLGAIALQGVRRAAPTLGETVLVVGLGAIGLLTVQLLRANGCAVIALDPDPRRRGMARDCGALQTLGAGGGDAGGRVHRLTGGFGADAAIVTASSSDDRPLTVAVAACRAKGRVVVVGDVSVAAARDQLYQREIDLLISTSTGPGRYDPVYEAEGQDYPLPYVRWTENRNMEAYVALLASGSVSLDPLRPETWPIDDAPKAYEALKGDVGSRPVLCLLRYPEGEADAAPSPVLALTPARRAAAGRVRVALIGAGAYAKGVLLPALAKRSGRFAVEAVVSRSGANAKETAARMGARIAATDPAAVFADPDIDLVIVATRHDLHAGLALQGLMAGKHVFVEKPLALDQDSLDRLAGWFAQAADPPLLMTGFNRRFAPAITALRTRLESRAGPMVIDYRMNAGPLPRDHWVYGPEGGGRNLGEACHIYDLFVALTGSRPVKISATAAAAQGVPVTDNFAASIGFADGSLATLTYSALGDPTAAKEAMDLHCDGMVATLDDYRRLSVSGDRAAWRARSRHKGQGEMLDALADCLMRGGDWPVPLADQIAATRIALEVERVLRGTDR